MVKRLSFIPLIGLLFLMCSCDFFFRTPFPQDLVYWDKWEDLRSAIQVIPQEYRLSTLGEIGILRGYYDIFDHSLGKLIVFDSNLNILYNQDANVGRMEMIAENGDYIIGNLNFGPISGIAASNTPNPAPAPTPAIDDFFGFSSGGNNFAIQLNDDLLKLYTYTNLWTQIGGMQNIGIDSQYKFRALSYSPEADTLYLFLKNDSNGNVYEIAIDATDLDPAPASLPDGGHVVVGLATDQEPQFVFSTTKGFVIRDWSGTYTLHSLSDGSVIAQKKIEIEDEKKYLEAIDTSGNHRYIFNTTNRMLYHSRFWW